MRTFITAAAAALAIVGCGGPERPPLPPSLMGQPVSERREEPKYDGFPMKLRPACTDEVRAATRNGDLQTITRIASQGGNFNCDYAHEIPPLDSAVYRDDPVLVQAMLAAGADPNARWGGSGDNHPLQMAAEGYTTHKPAVHRARIMQLLLQHGADPNARWCPFESRGSDPDGSPARRRAGSPR